MSQQQAINKNTNTPQETPRAIIQHYLKSHLLGYGSDIVVKPTDQEQEIITQFPLKRYYTGILFPQKSKVDTQAESDFAETSSKTEEGEENTGNVEEEQLKIDFDDDKELNEKKGKDKETIITPNTFYPTNIGLTICVPNELKTLDVEINTAIYKEIKGKEKKIHISEEAYHSFVNKKSNFPFKEYLKYENGYLNLIKALDIFKNPKKEKEEDKEGEKAPNKITYYDIYDEFKKSDALTNKQNLKLNLKYFESLCRRMWQRQPIKEQINIEIPNETIKEHIVFIEESSALKDEQIILNLWVKTYQYKNKKYVKLTLQNKSTEHPPKKFSNGKESLNAKCFFQAEIKINGKEIEPYKSFDEFNPYDDEASRLNYLYKNVNSYGIGHNCSVIWEEQEKPTWIKTTFFPHYDLRDTKNKFEQSDFENSKYFELLENSLDIYDLSDFSTVPKEKVLTNLKAFITIYEKWIKGLNNDESDEAKYFFKQLNNNLDRLKSNLKLLEGEQIFKAFKLANTAMLIQLIISNDKDFGGKEKELSEIKNDINYNDLDFFRNYDFKRLKFRPKYRPFQLAFLLLNIETVTNYDSENRNDIVDLLWFPTGGGKTEAYLAVTALTIIWRRMINENNYGGTTVIMRYTLRLLTAQQFERASRLIVSLEFLRNFYPQILKDEPITIGQWVGSASTPNKVADAVEFINDIDSEQNNPQEKNKFPINSCAWCGCKLVSKNPKTDAYVQGYRAEGKYTFYTKCINKKCFCTTKLPIRYVDEMLYQHPPTLLFGTVDKFAMLSWREEGHKFFNSLGDGLPPELIIQDELHLLSGALGSTVGFFETVIEMLCTKTVNGTTYKPNIISSTATTRNTEEQIRALFNNRKANVFPPSGINHNDSFFARQDTNVSKSKRRYVGIMPTGKSYIDTQLKILGILIASRADIYLKYKDQPAVIDKYWTLVSYYGNLKGVGRIYNKVGDEIKLEASVLQNRMFDKSQARTTLTFNYNDIPNRTKELTSRIEGTKIKKNLKDLEERSFQLDNISKSESGYTYLKNVTDLVLATNMISVGIDIERLNVMLVNHQPKNIAEYIQASSRVGRKDKGLVCVLLDAQRARDKSHFEHFINFHQAFYKSVEPISLTPFTEPIINKMLTSLAVSYIRQSKGILNGNKDAINFKAEFVNQLRAEVNNRFESFSEEIELFNDWLDDFCDDWLEKIKNDIKQYQGKDASLLIKPSEKTESNKEWVTMQSMREVDSSSFFQIDLPARQSSRKIRRRQENTDDNE